MRLDAAIERMRRTLELDPLSVTESTNFAWYLLMARRYDAAVEQIRKTLAIDPAYTYAHEILGRIYEQQGKYPEAITELRIAVERSRGGPHGRDTVLPVRITRPPRGRHCNARGEQRRLV